MHKQSASKDIAGYQQTRKGKRPIRVHNLLKKAEAIAMAIKTAHDTALIENDPLIQYLKKTAEKDIPTKGLIDSAGSLETNEDTYLTRPAVAPAASMNPGPTPEMEAHAKNPLDEYKEKYFEHGGDAVRKKYTEKDRPVDKDMTPKSDYVEQKT